MATDQQLYPLHINGARLQRRIEALAQIGALPGGGVCRLALSDEDRQGRDLVCAWMRELGLDISIDRIGNVVGVRAGKTSALPVLTGSHIDTVASAGVYDGNLGVLAGLEVIETLNQAGIETRRPIAVAFFTNEEGARFSPGMMGSGVHQGSRNLDDMLGVTGIDGKSVADELIRIGYAGDTEVGRFKAHRYIELHIEQGPVLERQQIDVAAVTGVQGISWTEFHLQGVSNHAGTTPMEFRHDAGFAAARISVEARRLAAEIGHGLVATVGQIKLTPNLVNVIPREALMTVDLRNMDEQRLQTAEHQLNAFVDQVAEAEGIEVSRRMLARSAPVFFAPDMITLVENCANKLGFSCRRMPSGGGHDAQIFAPNCPTAMIFAPSQGGISHSIDEYTAPHQLAAGADVLLQVMLSCAMQQD